MGIVRLSFNLDGISSTAIATTEPDKITIGNKDWLMSSTIKKEAIKPEKVPESVLSPILMIGYNLPTIAAKESPIDKNNKAATAIGILNNITVIVHPINNQVAPVCSPFDSLSRSIK